MESTTRRVHPLLTAAAVSITVFSAVGVAAITGFIPHSKGQPKDDTPVAAAAAPATAAEPAPAPQAAPAPKPVKKPVVRHSAPMVPPAKPVETVAYSERPAATVAQ